MPKIVLSNEISEEVEPMNYAYNMLNFFRSEPIYAYKRYAYKKNM